MADYDAASMNRQYLFPLIYIIPTYIFYLIILYILFLSKNKSQFSGSFNKILGFSIIYYIFCSFSYYMDFRVPKTPFFIYFVKLWGIRSFWVTFIHWSPLYFGYGVQLFNVILAFNRFTVFILKTNYQNFWDKYIKYFVLFCILFPFLLTWHVPFMDIYMELNNSSNSDGTKYSTEGLPNAFPYMNVPRNLAILQTITAILSFFMNSYVVFQILKQKYGNGKLIPKNKIKSSQDIEMCIYTILIFLTDIATFVLQYLLISWTNMDLNTLLTLLSICDFVNDLVTLAPAWFLLFTHKILKKQFKIYFGFSKAQPISVIPNTMA